MIEQVNTKELMKEHRVLHDLINDLIKRSNLSAEAVKAIREYAKEIARDVTNETKYYYHRGGSNDNSTEISQRDNLLKDSTCNNTYLSSSRNSQDILNANFKGIWKPILETIQAAMVRQECLVRVVNEYNNIDEVQADADKGAERANSAYRQIMSGTPYAWNINIIGKKHAKLPSRTQWKINHRTDYRNYTTDANGSRVYAREKYYLPKHTWYIDETYMDVVDKYKIHTTDIAGKNCFTLKAELVEEHELKDQGVQLFKAIVGYTKIGTNFSDKTKAGVRASIFTEERWIAIQDQDGRRVEQATGKDKSWAIRTMKQRMKSSMLKQMGLK